MKKNVIICLSILIPQFLCRVVLPLKFKCFRNRSITKRLQAEEIGRKTARLRTLLSIPGNMTAFGDSIGHAKELKLPTSETDADDDRKNDPSWSGMVINATFPCSLS